ncbi:FtsX-like permease family protein [Actinomadura gamaensis]|uniref:FtsX-like permease family protein n=1 Tax=Actinomadura gamaensis TaxID=1763541 RepID=A0ABV9U7G8_9ACTN
MSALGRIVRSGVARRRVQTLVLALTTMLAVTASVLAAGLIVASRAPFDHAFARQHGAHLTAQFDGGRATPQQLAATAHASGVTAAAGPFSVVTLRPSFALDGDEPPAPPMTVAGRAGPGGAVDALDLTEGRWAAARGEIVLAADGPPVRLGRRVTFPELPGRPALTVVGHARSIGRSADAWVVPAQLAALNGRHAPGYQMLYRLRNAATDAQVSAGRAAVAAAAPRGSLTGAGSYLRIRHAAQRATATFVPFIVAFGVLALAISVLTIGVVVNAAVAAATHRIGVLKSLGFTPSQVVTAYVGKALIPAAIGTGLGVVLGNLLAIPAMRQEGSAYQTGARTVAPWIDVAVPAAALAAVALTALVPALRAGRLRAAEAIALGRAPRPGRGRAVRRVLGRLPLARPLSLGLAAPFARPARSVAMGLALMLGTAAVAFGTGLALSLNGIENGLNRDEPGAVIAHTFAPLRQNGAPPREGSPNGGPPNGKPGADSGPPRRPKPASPAAIARTIQAQPGTRRYFSTSQAQIGVAGLTSAVSLIAYDGDASWGAFQLVSGRWFHGAGEAVVPSGMLKATGTRLGDTITMTSAGRTAPVRIVGEALMLRQDGLVVLTGTASAAPLGLRFDPGATEFQIDLKPGTDARAYRTALNRDLQAIGASAERNGAELSATVVAMDALAGMLTALLVAVAGLGVLNTVVLDTRERVRDLGVLKALGMAPRQVVAMIITTVGLVGVCFAAAGIPIGMALHAAVLPLMGRAAGTGIPHADLAVYHVPLLALLLLGGVLIAIAGALLPAGWAARTRTSTALRTE